MKVTTRPITNQERTLFSTFQEILQELILFWKNPNPETYIGFKSNIMKYDNFPFFEKIRNFIKETDTKLEKIKIANDVDINNLQNIIKNAEKNLLNGNEKLFISITSQIDHSVLSHRNKKINFQRKHLWDKSALSTIFGVYGVIPQFEDYDQKQILDMNPSIPLWTYLNIPNDKINDYEYMVWWIMKLRTDDNPVEITKQEFPKYLEFADLGPKYTELKKMLSIYLHNNDKKLIPHIVENINYIPLIRNFNNIRKKEISTVYRGIPNDRGFSIKQLIQIDRNNKYVATSSHRNSARNFALQKGHLENDDSRRSLDGIILVYEVTEEAIFFDTSIFGGLFNEAEIVIDATKATFTDSIHV